MPKKPLHARSLAAATLACAGLALGVAACGDDDSDSTSTSDAAVPEPVEVTVTATEYDFELSAAPTPGTKTVSFTNDGAEPHVLVFARVNDGFTTEEAIELDGEKGSAELVGSTQAAPGSTESFKIKKALEAGPYAMLCPLRTKEGEAHYELGQLEEFELE